MATGVIVGRDQGDDDPVVRPGEVVRVPMLFMDHQLQQEMRRALGLQVTSVHDGMGNLAGHRPGYCFGGGVSAGFANAAVEARDAYVRNLGEAWKTPTQRATPPPRPSTQDAEQAYRAYVDRISNAWRSP